MHASVLNKSFRHEYKSFSLSVLFCCRSLGRVPIINLLPNLERNVTIPSQVLILTLKQVSTKPEEPRMELTVTAQLCHLQKLLNQKENEQEASWTRTSQTPKTKIKIMTWKCQLRRELWNQECKITSMNLKEIWK